MKKITFCLLLSSLLLCSEMNAIASGHRNQKGKTTKTTDVGKTTGIGKTTKTTDAGKTTGIGKTTKTTDSVIQNKAADLKNKFDNLGKKNAKFAALKAKIADYQKAKTTGNDSQYKTTKTALQEQWKSLSPDERKTLGQQIPQLNARMNRLQNETRTTDKTTDRTTNRTTDRTTNKTTGLMKKIDTDTLVLDFLEGLQ